MNKICRFCKNPSVHVAFSANRDTSQKQIDLFACTNCGFGRHGEIAHCHDCDIAYVEEGITQEEISNYYSAVEDEIYFQEQFAREKTFAGYLHSLETHYPKKGKLLDVGTNTGLFVKLAKNNGWDAYGLEPNKKDVAYAKKEYHLELIAKPFEENTFPKNSFDVITMWDVIEHFTDSVAEMKKVYQFLKPGGVFAFSTVDPASLLAKAMRTNWPWYMEMHRVFFSRKAADLYLRKAGFKKILFEPHWRYLSLGYFCTRIAAVSSVLARFAGLIVKRLGLSRVLIPYYANDLYNCYALK